MPGSRPRVALVEVPAVDVVMNGERILDDFTLGHPKYPQLVLAANLRRHDIEVELIDLKGAGSAQRTVYGEADYCGQNLELARVGLPLESVADRLFAADVVGISANFTFERSMVAQTVAFLRTRGTRPFIVIGGHDATADPAYYLRHGADLCVLGEGETAIVEIARAVGEGARPRIPGTASLEEGTMLRGGRRHAHSFDEIVLPSHELLASTHFPESPDGPLPADVTPRIASLETSRGCGEACSFCDVTFVVGRYRAMPFAMVERQIEAFHSAGIRTLQVIDDNLLYRLLPSGDGEEGRQTILRIFRRLYEEGFAWEFFNGFQLGLFERDGVIDTELIETLYRHGTEGGRCIGCFRSYVPIDKVTTQEMALLRKLKPLQVAREVVAAIARCQVPALALGFVIGSIRETAETLAETEAVAQELSDLVHRSSAGTTLSMVLPLCTIPLPGTPDFLTFRDHIDFPPDTYPELYNIFMSVLRTEHFSPLEMTRQRQRIRDELNRAPATTEARTAAS